MALDSVNSKQDQEENSTSKVFRACSDLHTLEPPYKNLSGRALDYLITRSCYEIIF